MLASGRVRPGHQTLKPKGYCVCAFVEASTLYVVPYSWYIIEGIGYLKQTDLNMMLATFQAPTVHNPYEPLI